jgi:uncharacterized protein (TIGR02246 family)
VSDRDPVEAQLAAYNARDADRFAECYAEDVLVEDADGNEIVRGRDALRCRYAAMFAAHPALSCELLSRIRVGAYVLDEERITGRGGEEHVVAAYHVAGGSITRVRFYR